MAKNHPYVFELLKPGEIKAAENASWLMRRNRDEKGRVSNFLQRLIVAGMGSDPKVFVFDEVAKHNHQRDCWLIISGKVYDVTPFLEEHPGGDEVLILASEKDATDDFENVGHSLTAIDQMEKYYVGNVDMSTVPKPIDYQPPASQSATAPSAQSSGSSLKILQFLIPLLIIGVAFYVQFYGKKQ